MKSSKTIFLFSLLRSPFRGFLEIFAVPGSLQIMVLRPLFLMSLATYCVSRIKNLLTGRRIAVNRNNASQQDRHNRVACFSGRYLKRLLLLASLGCFFTSPVSSQTASVVINPTESTVNEGGVTEYTVVLTTQPTVDVIILAKIDETDFVRLNPAILRFTRETWNMAQTVTVTGVEDGNTFNEVLDLSHTATSQDPAYRNVLIPTQIVRVNDNDRFVATVSPITQTLVEGSTGTYTLVLNSRPTANVMVTVTSENINAVTTTPTGPLMFTSNNWNAAQTVTVMAVEDANTSGGDYRLSHRATSGDRQYNGALISQATVIVRDNDRPAGVRSDILVSPPTLRVGEGSVASYTLVLDRPPTDSVMIAVASGDPEAVTVTSPLTFTTGNWHIPQRVIVRSLQDIDSNNERVELTYTATSADAAYNDLAITRLFVAVDDDETSGMVTVTPTTRTVIEGSTGSYTVTLNAQPTANVMVTVTSGNAAVTATSTPPLPLMFTSVNWNTPQTVTVTAVEDANTVSETVNVTHAARSQDTRYNTGLTIDPVVVTVVDNDAAGVTVTPTTRAIDEGSTGTYTLVLNRPPAANVTIAVESRDKGAVTVSPASLNFTRANWNMPQEVTVRGVRDADVSNESVRLIHRAVSTDVAYSGVRVMPVTVLVTDNVAAGALTITPTTRTIDEGSTGTYTVVLDTRPTVDVMVTVTSGNAAVTATSTPPLPLMFTPVNWNTPQTVTVTGVADADANNESVNLTHTASGDSAYAGVTAAVTVRVTDDETAGVIVTPTMQTVPEGDSRSYDIRLTSQPTANVFVAVTSADYGAVSVSQMNLTFTSRNWNMAQTVTVTALEDADSVSDRVRLTNRFASTDPDYGGVADTPVNVVVMDNDPAIVTVASTMPTVSEGGISTYTLVLDTIPTAKVTVAVESLDTEAVTVNPTSLTFASYDWNLAKTVVVTGVEDEDSSDEMVNVTHTATSMDTAYNNLAVAAAVVSVEDNETAGVTVNSTTRNISEGGTGTYKLVLNTAPTAEVTVTVTSGNAAVTASPTPLVFTSDNWNAPQTVTVTAVEDANTVSETVSLSHTMTSGDDTYDAVPVVDVMVNVMDNEVRGVSVSTSTLTVNENGRATYTLVLNTRPRGNNSVVQLHSSNTNAVKVTPGLLFTRNNWNKPQTVTVAGVEDANTVGETVRLTHEVRSIEDHDHNFVTPVVVTVTVTDDNTNRVGTTASVTLSATDLTINYILDTSGSYTVMLGDRRPTSPVAVILRSSELRVTRVISSQRIVFTLDDWNMAKTVVVAPLGVGRANLTHQVASQDPTYHDLPVSPVTVTVTRPPDVTVTPTSRTIDEGSTSTYTVVLDTQPTSQVRMTVTSDNTAVTATATPALPLTFTSINWNTPQTVTLTAVEDANMVSETVNVTHTARYPGFAIDPVVVTVRDNDIVAGVAVSQTTRTVTEGGAASNYTVVLRTQPTANVVVTVTSGNTAAVTATATPALPLTFTSINWNTPQTVTLTAVEDANMVSETVNVTHTTSSQDTDYNTDLAIDPVVVTVRDNDIGTFNLDVNDSGGLPNQSDGLMVGRYLFGIRDPVGLLDTIPGNPSFSAVTANIARGVTSGRLDVDDSGGLPNQSDGLMVGRYLFGIRDARGLLDTIPGNPSFSAVTTNIGGLVR